MVKNEYQPVQQNRPLTDTEREEIWAKTISGSQIKKLLDYPLALYNEKILGKKVIFPQRVINAMEFGKEMEPKIVEHFPVAAPYQVQPDKRTFRSINFPYLSANIDGWLVDDKQKHVGIFEAKCLKEGTIEQVRDNYQPQIQYYLWFFNFSEAVLGFFNKETNSYQYLKVARNDDYVRQLLVKIVTFVENHLIPKKPPQLTFSPETTVDLATAPKPKLIALVNQLKKIKAGMAVLKSLNQQKKAVEKEIAQFVSPQVKYLIGEDFHCTKVEFDRSHTDWESFRREMENEYNQGFAFADFDTRFMTVKKINYWKVDEKKKGG